MIVISIMIITVMMTVMIIRLAMFFFLSGFSSADTDDSQDSR